ncbi:MAG: dihydropteroate synthase [Waddliaceae bacterium]
MPARQPKIMGIINATPDSFYDGGKCFSLENAVKQGIDMYREGADILDIGGESTRPSAHPVGEEEELARVIPVIKTLKKEIPIPLSIDTMKPRVAAAAVEAGAAIINDVSGFRDPEMVQVAINASVPICVMHMKGTPKTMQINPRYEQGVVSHLLQWFEERVNCLCHAGIKKNHIILDPGIGFGKTVDDNLKILQNLQRFTTMGFPLLLGLSRKSFMGKIVNKEASKLLSMTIAMNTIGLLAGVDIIRVHDVAEHRDIVELITHLK